MTNIRIITSEQTGDEYVIIDRGNEEFTSMPKAEYDRRQAEQSTPIVAAE
jgi:hypothetical protein